MLATVQLHCMACCSPSPQQAVAHTYWLRDDLPNEPPQPFKAAEVPLQHPQHVAAFIAAGWQPSPTKQSHSRDVAVTPFAQQTLVP
jgi:hypothetical protein